MNVQIFGKKKCFATKAAERFFKERGIKYQLIDIIEKGISKRELEAVLYKIKDVDLLFDKKSPLYESLFVEFIKRDDSDKKELLLTHPALMVTPLVRECVSSQATVGEALQEWKNWMK